MEGLAPPLKCLIEIQAAIQNGESARQGLLRYMQSSDPNDSFASDSRDFLHAWEQGRDWRRTIARIKSPYRRALLELIASSFAGQSILLYLEELKTDLASTCEMEIRHHIEMLPVKMLIPLLALQFPSFLLLLFGPLLRNLVQELSK